MRKVLFAFAAITLISAASSCKKCGHCTYSDGRPNSSATCKSNTMSALGIDEYAQAEANCKADDGTWVKD